MISGKTWQLVGLEKTRNIHRIIIDKNNPNMTFIERSKWLADNVSGDMIVLVNTDKAETSKEIDKLYGEYTQAGYEGQMVRQDTPYECKRSKNLLKRKLRR